MQEMWVQSLAEEDPLEKQTATHSSILAWRIPWTKVPGGLQSMGSPGGGHDLAAEYNKKRYTCVSLKLPSEWPPGFACAYPERN